jgi:phosphate transport system substrate-binding protein
MRRVTMRRLALAGLAFAASTLAAHAAENKIVITGASTVAPLIAEVGKRFEERNPGTQVDVQTGGSARGVNDARTGLANIGMVSRPLKDDEKDLHAFPVARDGVAIILHRDNPIAALNDQQIVDIYTGKSTDWSQVGGAAGPITVVNKAEGRSTLELFLHYFKLKASDVKAQVIIGDNQQGIKTVSGNPGSIGYVSVGTAEFEAGQGTPIKLLGVNGVAASVENVGNNTYPLSRPLNLVTKEPPTGLIKSFIDFAQSADVRDLVKEQFFVPNGP